MKKTLLATLTFSVILIGFIIYSCTKNGIYPDQPDSKLSPKSSVSDSTINSSSTACEVIKTLIDSLPHDTIDLSLSNKSVYIGHIRNNSFSINNLSNTDIAYIKDFIISLTSEKYKVSKSSIYIDSCEVCDSSKNNFPHISGLYVIYNNVIGPNNITRRLEEQILLLRSKIRMPDNSIIATNIILNNSNDSIFFGGGLGGNCDFPHFTISFDCVAYPSGGEVCGCCDFVYHWYYCWLPNCECNITAGSSCRSGSCRVHATINIILGK